MATWLSIKDLAQRYGEYDITLRKALLNNETDPEKVRRIKFKFGNKLEGNADYFDTLFSVKSDKATPIPSSENSSNEANLSHTASDRAGDKANDDDKWIHAALRGKDKTIEFLKEKLKEVEADRIDYLKSRLVKTENRVDEIYSTFLDYMRDQKDNAPLLIDNKNIKDEKDKEIKSTVTGHPNQAGVAEGEVDQDGPTDPGNSAEGNDVDKGI